MTGVDNRLEASCRGNHDSKVSVFEAFYLATTGGGEALKLPLGIFKEGYICDFQVIDINIPINKLPNYLDNEEEKTPSSKNIIPFYFRKYSWSLGSR